MSHVLSAAYSVWKVHLERAARLLLRTDDTLALIAEKTGFSDAFRLSHKLKKAFGISPPGLSVTKLVRGWQMTHDGSL